MNKRGFTLLELVMVIVLLGIAIPLILRPFMQSAKGIAVAAGAPALAAAARYCLESGIADAMPSPNAWPKGATGDYQASCTDPANPTLAVAVTGSFYDAALAARTDGTLDNLPPPAGQDRYLLITATASDPSTGESVSLRSLKTKAF